MEVNPQEVIIQLGKQLADLTVKLAVNEVAVEQLSAENEKLRQSLTDMQARLEQE